MRIKKVLLGLIIAISSSKLTLANDNNIYTTNSQYQIFQGINWNTQQWTNWFDNYFSNILLSAGNIQTPIGNFPLGKFLKNIWDGLKCEIPSWNGNISGLNVKLPTRIIIPLPCKNVYVDFSQDFANLINNITTSINSKLPKDFEKCIHNPTNPECVKKGYKRLMLSLKNDQLEGEAVISLANKTNEEINKEIEKNVNATSQPIMPVSGNKVVFNENVLKANLGAMKEAGNSLGKIAYPDKQIVQGTPREVQRQYAYTVKKQMYREIVIQTFQNRIDEAFQELTALKQAIDSFCKADVKSVPVIPPSIGGFASIDLNKLKKLALNRCCCCDAIPAIHSAKAEVMARISQAEASIVQTLHQVSLEVRMLISQEQYKTRTQIHNEFLNLLAQEKMQTCLALKLEYQRNKLLIYNMMLQLAILETQYSNLNEKELKKFLEIQKEKFKEYSSP